MLGIYSSCRRSSGRARYRRRCRRRALPSPLLARSIVVVLLCLLLGAGCNRSYDVGDHVLVEWEGEVYPAMIIEIPGPGKFKVHYDGYDEMWDEVILRRRIKQRVEGTPPNPEPPEKVRRTAVEASKKNQFKAGERIKVEWHGHYYPATVVGIVGPERYRIHYEGYGREWDENVSRSRIQAK